MTPTSQQVARDAVALVLGAGQGARLGLGPKALLRIGGESLLARVVRMLQLCVGRILVGVQGEHLDQVRAELGDSGDVYAGGATRNATLLSLFEKSVEPLVVIHLAARPFASADRLRHLIEAAKEHGAACGYVPATQDLACIEDGFAKSCLTRATAGIMQMPMVVQRPLLERMLRYDEQNESAELTPLELAMHLGIPVRAIRDDPSNIKITTPLDWEIATKIIEPAHSSLTSQ